MNHMNRSLLNLTLAAVLSTLAAGTALAEPAAKAAPTSPTSFKDYDSNGDGTVSQEEFRARGGNEQTFRKADANSDNMLSSEEFAKASANGGRS
jgi:hypothetical protein